MTVEINKLVAQTETNAGTFIAGPDGNTALVLNNLDFIDMQIYVKLALALPKDAAVFKTTYPTDMKELFENDTALYADLETHLPVIHNHALDFELQTVSQFISLGGYIRNFAKDANLGFKKLKDSVSQKSLVEEEIETVKINFEDLIELAGGIESKSSKLSGDLAAFKKTIQGDEKIIILLHERLNAVDLSAVEIFKKLQAIRKRHTEKVENDEVQTRGFGDGLALTGKIIIWATVIPGVIFWAVGDKLQDNADDLKLEYDRLVAEDKKWVARFDQCRGLTTSLTKNMKELCDKVERAILAVDKIQRSCNYLQTDFQAINTNVEKAYKRREKVHLALDQIDRMIKTWDEVRVLAQSFEIYGLLKPSK